MCRKIVTQQNFYKSFIYHCKIQNMNREHFNSYYFLTATLGVLFHFVISALFYFILEKILIHFNYANAFYLKIIKIIILYFSPVIISLYGLYEGLVTHVKKVKVIIPEVSKNIKICHLSDIHTGAIYKRKFVQKIVNKIKNMKPDFVVITGDLFDGTCKVGMDWLSPFDQLDVPIFYVTGNHEHYYGCTNALKLIEKTKIKHVLRNEPITFENLIIYGHDFQGNEDVDCTDFFDFCKRIPRKENFVNVVLQHIPSISCEFLGKTNVDLVLSGHTHGGPIFPINIFIHMSNSCSKGLYEKNGHYVYVSNGVGTCLTPMRVTAKSVIAEINIDKI